MVAFVLNSQVQQSDSRFERREMANYSYRENGHGHHYETSGGFSERCDNGVHYGFYKECTGFVADRSGREAVVEQFLDTGGAGYGNGSGRQTVGRNGGGSGGGARKGTAANKSGNTSSGSGTRGGRGNGKTVVTTTTTAKNGTVKVNTKVK